MRVSIVTREVNDRSAFQKQVFTACGNACQLYAEKHVSGRPMPGSVISPASFLAEDHVRETSLFLFHFVDEGYPLLQTIKRLEWGLVILDLRGTTAYERVPVHYADLCLVGDAMEMRALREATECAEERIAVLPDGKDCDEDWLMTMDQAMRGVPPGKAQTETGSNVAVPTVDDLRATLLIRDPELDGSAILDRLAETIRRCQAAGGYGPDVTSLGPEALRSTPVREEASVRDCISLFQFHATLDDLAAQAHLSEPSFQSRVPLVGRLIVAVRRLWNWMSTKWYVRGWMDQQTAFNRELIGAVEELLRIQESNEQRIHVLERQVESLLRDNKDTR